MGTNPDKPESPRENKLQLPKITDASHFLVVEHRQRRRCKLNTVLRRLRLFGKLRFQVFQVTV